MKISIVIPAYEMKGRGVSFLEKLLTSVTQQSHKNLEVIVSDSSGDDELLNLVLEYNDERFRHIFFDERGCSANTNNGIKIATGDIIKPMFQDDWFGTKNCLSDLVRHYQDDRWFVYPRNQVKEGVGSVRVYPRWNDDVVLGRNTISSPSTIAYPRDAGFYFDENLNWLLDCEFYYRLYLKYGEPFLLEDSAISISDWGGQTSYGVTKAVRKHDINYVRDKYNLI